MVRIMGNSPERVQIKDLNDVIYYKQIKEFSDSDFAQSKDLNRELKTGRVIQLEKNDPFRGSETLADQNPSTITVNDLRSVLREFLPHMMGNNGSSDIKQAVKEIAPIIATLVRQEISRAPVSTESVATKIENAFNDVSYVPDVSSEGLVSKVRPKEIAVSGDSAQDALTMLKKLRNQS